MAKLEHDKAMYMQNVERMKQENFALSKEIGGLKNQIAKSEKKIKEEREKIIAERDELAKTLAKLTQKNTQYQHELRKKEVEVTKMKDQMLKKTLIANARHMAEFTANGNSSTFKARSVNTWSEFIKRC